MNIEYKYITPNKYSRPKRKLSCVKKIIIHWVANSNSTAMANRNFFERRKNGTTGYGSAHEIIDLNGDIVVAIPMDEVSYNCGASRYMTKAKRVFGSESPNNQTYGIECTHIDWKGTMTEATKISLVERCAYLCDKFGLNPLEDLWLHHDVTGKLCHQWFIDNPDKWEQFKQSVAKEMNEMVEKKAIKVNLLGTPTEIEGVFIDGRNYVGIREILEKLGYKIGWNQDTQTVMVNK